MRLHTLVFAYVAFLVLPLALVVDDVYAKRRPQPVALMGVASWLIVMFGAPSVSTTDLGRALIMWLEG